MISKMREILFRGKIADEPNEWAYGSLVINPKTNDCVIHSFMRKHIGIFHVDLYTAGQYTGLKDKNGKKIFEGDVVRADNGKKVVVGYVVYEPWHGAYMIIPTYGDGINLMHHGRTRDRTYEVIGNRFDNPDLIK